MAVLVLAIAAVASSSEKIPAKLDFVSVKIFLTLAALVTTIFVGWVIIIKYFASIVSLVLAISLGKSSEIQLVKSAFPPAFLAMSGRI
jgi:hypothetical protein